MGRPKKAAASTEQICKNLGSLGCTMNEISTAVGLSVSTLRRRPKLMEAIESGKYFKLYDKWFGRKGEVPYPLTTESRRFLQMQVVPK